MKGLKRCPESGMGESSEEVASFAGFAAAPRDLERRKARSFECLDILMHSSTVYNSA